MSQAPSTAPATITAGIYVRISSDPDLTRLGVQRQEADCREYVDRKGWALARVYEDNDLSAYGGRVRPGYRRLLADIHAGVVQAVVAWHPDRLHRHPRELEEFIDACESAGALVETVRAGSTDLGTPSGRAVARTLGAWARYESEHKAERQRRKHHELALAGKDAGGGRPFGYESDRLTVRAGEAALLRGAAARFLAGDSLRSLCRDWNAQGVATVTGAAWSAQVMRRMLGSARISGRRELRTHPNGSRKDIGRITSDHAAWPAIISAKDSDRIRELLGDGRRRVNGNPRQYLLTGGMARCSLCGKPLAARPRGDKRRSMVCASGPGFHGCGKIRVLAEPVEQLVAEAVLQAVDGGALIAVMNQHDDRAVVDELLGVNAKLASLAREWAEDQITRGEWTAARGALEGRRVALQRRVDAQRRTLSLDGIPDPLRPAWDGLQVPQRRAIIEAVVDRVIVKPAVRGWNFFDAGRIEITWRI